MTTYTSEFSEMAANRLNILFKSCWIRSDITLKRSPSCRLWCWFSLRVFVSCFRPVSKWPHFSFLSEQVFPLCFPFFLFFPPFKSKGLHWHWNRKILLFFKSSFLNLQVKVLSYRSRWNIFFLFGGNIQPEFWHLQVVLLMNCYLLNTADMVQEPGLKYAN